MDNRKMFYDATPETFAKARMLRNNMTKEEKILWTELSANKINGLRFKPQHPINCFIVDFYCPKAKLVIEIDGSSHEKTEQRHYDGQRTLQLQSLGLEVLKFKNKEITGGLDYVLKSNEKTTTELLARNQSFTPALKGGFDLNSTSNSSFQGVEGKKGGSE